MTGLTALFHRAHVGFAVVKTYETSTNHVFSPVSSVWIKTCSKNISEIKGFKTGIGAKRIEKVFGFYCAVHF